MGWQNLQPNARMTNRCLSSPGLSAENHGKVKSLCRLFPRLDNGLPLSIHPGSAILQRDLTTGAKRRALKQSLGTCNIWMCNIISKPWAKVQDLSALHEVTVSPKKSVLPIRFEEDGEKSELLCGIAGRKPEDRIDHERTVCFPLDRGDSSPLVIFAKLALFLPKRFARFTFNLRQRCFCGPSGFPVLFGPLQKEHRPRGACDQFLGKTRRTENDGCPSLIFSAPGFNSQPFDL